MKQKKTALIELYKKTMVKWDRINHMLADGLKHKAMSLSGKKCAFCEDAIKREHKWWNKKSGCQLCWISHEICGLGNTLLSKFWRSCHDLEEMTRACKKIYFALEKELMDLQSKRS